MKRAALTFLLGVAVVGIAGPLRAQAPDSLIQAGVRSYRDLDFDRAAGYLRRALTLLRDRPDTAHRREALVYLGATDVFRQESDSARSVFRQLVALDPHYRIDALIFPPEVTSVFDAVRRATPATLVALPARARFTAGDGALAGSVFGSTYHQIRVEVQAVDASVVRRVYAGPVGDSLAITWDGRGTNGLPVATARYLLTVTSLDSAGGPARILRVPLDVTTVPMDTEPSPLAPELLPVRSGNTRALASLLGGLAIGTAVAVLPSVVVSDASPSPGRFVVGGAVAIGGVVGFLSGRRNQAPSRAIAVNDSLRAAWQVRAAAVASENERRRRAATMTVVVGVPQVLEPDR